MNEVNKQTIDGVTTKAHVVVRFDNEYSFCD